MNVDTNFLIAEFVDNVKIHPNRISGDIQKSVLKVLKPSKEGICSNHGYIKKDSIRIVKISCGQVEAASFHGYVNYLVKYSALVCNPVKGNIVEAIVVNINNFGILCSSFIEDSETDEKISILEIIIPKHSLSIQSDIDLQNSVKINDSVKVEIVGKKYQLFNKKISIIGKIVNFGFNVGNQSDVNGPVGKTVDDDDDDEEDFYLEEDDEDEEGDEREKDGDDEKPDETEEADEDDNDDDDDDDDDDDEDSEASDEEVNE